MWIFRFAIIGYVAIFLVSKWGDLPHPDADALQGTWEIVSVERAGTPDPSPVGYTLKFVGDEMHFQVPLDAPLEFATVTVKPMSEEQMLRMARY